MCETIVALHFQHFSMESFALASKLSTASMLRVAKKVFSLRSKTADAMCQALHKSAKLTRCVSHSSSEFMAEHIDFVDDGVKDCPLCMGPLHKVTETTQYGNLSNIYSTMCITPWNQMHISSAHGHKSCH